MSSFKVTKMFTGFAGLPVCQNPHRELTLVYNRILRNLEHLPKDSKYRAITEELIKERKKIVETTPDPAEIEKKTNYQCEQLLEQANMELGLVNTMRKCEPWKPLEEEPPANQWKWPL